MPGKILEVMATTGKVVKKGEPLVIMEAMKMEHTVKAPRSGAIDAVCIAEGEQIKEGTELLILTDA